MGKKRDIQEGEMIGSGNDPALCGQEVNHTDLVPLADLRPNFLKLVKGTRSLILHVDRRELFNLLQTSDERFKEWKRTAMTANGLPVMNLTKWIAWPHSMLDKKTGEYKQVTLVAMVFDDGFTLGCASEGIYRGLLQAEHLFPTSPWNPGLRVKIVIKPADVGEVYLLQMPT